MANPKWRYRVSRHKVKKHSNNVPKIEATEKVEIPETMYYGNVLILTSEHNLSSHTEDKYTLAAVEKENGNFGKITILSGSNAGNVYEHVPYNGGNFHFNEYKGDSYFGVNFNRDDEQMDNNDKNAMVIVNVLNSIVDEANKQAAAEAKKEYEEMIAQNFSRPEY